MGFEKFPSPPESNEEKSPETEKFKLPLVNANELIPDIQPAPPLKEYNKSPAEDADTSYARTLKDKLEYYSKRQNEKVAEFLKEVENQILVDLGAGNSSAGYDVATRLKAKAYIGVEPNNYDSLHNIFTESGVNIAKQIAKEGRATVPVALEHEDALTFLRRLPDGSVSIMANGIDEYILIDSEYRFRLNTEIARVLNKSGAFISYRSVLGFADGTPYRDMNILQSSSDDIDGLLKYTFEKKSGGKKRGGS